MGERRIRVIPANPLLADVIKRKRTLRVAAYCRVSTDDEEQQSSFETQVKYYTEKINSHEGWQLAGIFADEGISGVRTKKRVQFNEMIAQCRKKKIDLILTKSISRFARNTVDCIDHVRLLKRLGIAVIFEKENIDTSHMNSEMILTCLSAFAQAESESASGNVTKGIRMGYKNGRFAFRYVNCLGYRQGADGEPEIVPEEAEIIHMIYQNYLDGDSLGKIKNTLESKGILTATGKKEWSVSVIQQLLVNEKYAGDILLQKTYVDDFLEGKTKTNRGELPKYYIENNHPAIIPREMFHRVQEEIARRKSKRPTTQKNSKTNRGKFSSQYALSERLVCGNCGCHYRRVTWSIHGRREVVWRCINRLEFGKKMCPDSPTMKEEGLHQAILEAVNSLAKGKGKEMVSCLQDTLVSSTAGKFDVHAIQRQLDEKGREFDRLLCLTGEEESEFLDRKIKQVSDEMAKLREQKEEAEKWIEQNKIKALEMESIMKRISQEPLDLTEYSDSLTYRIIERIAVISKEEINIRFVGGYEVRQRVD